LKKDLTLSFGTFVAGCLLAGLVWTTPIEQPLASISIVLGLVLSVVGFISSILIIKRKRETHRKKKT
jgi:uncharacterized membrane protein